ncbi:putative beta-lysine N-acetyltransferase [Cohnella sp.]|uniref:putative beta-lysine N-acetyltransferase n=1 Tax=Cohnella sp. TaxID=1883426 RepID=UPI003562C96F
MNPKYAVIGECKEISGPDFTMQVFFDPFNLRLRVDGYQGHTDAIMTRVMELSRQHGFTKAFVKAREADWKSFLSRGFILEGIFKGYYNGNDAYSVACYLSDERRTSDYGTKEDGILQNVLEMPRKLPDSTLPAGYTLRIARESDVKTLARLYTDVFQIYPTQMNDPAYIAKVMKDATVFYIIVYEGQIVSTASAEINSQYYHAEMTDCATLQDHRQHGFMKVLIKTLEEDLLLRNIHCFFSLSRALSFGMNAVLHQLGYEYTGRLTKNCYISDKLEDMNLWVKRS